MTVHITSWSEISTFRMCPHKWSLAYLERWTTAVTSPALQKGTMMHAVLEEHYGAMRRVQRGKLPIESFSKYVEKKINPLLYNESGDQNEVQDLVSWMYAGYLERYPIAQEMEEWEIIAVEHEAVVPLPNLLGRKSNFHLKMKMDLIARHRPSRKLYIWDHKTGANLPNDLDLAFNDQFGLYCWGMRQLGKPVWGAWYNALRTQRNKTDGQTIESRHSRTPLYRIDAELNTIATEAFLTIKRAYAIKEGLAERAPDSDRCKWMCQFREPCLAGRKGINEKQFLLD